MKVIKMGKTCQYCKANLTRVKSVKYESTKEVLAHYPVDSKMDKALLTDKILCEVINLYCIACYQQIDRYTL